MLPRIGTVREMVGILVTQRVKPVAVKLIGLNWVRILLNVTVIYDLNLIKVRLSAY
jgi:hypothetical protein